MKKDFFFILAVFLVGVVGIIYSKTNHNDVLTEKQKASLAESEAQEAGKPEGRLEIKYQSARIYSPRYSSDTDGLTADIKEYERDQKLDELSRVDWDAPTGGSESTTASWSELFNAWYVVMVDSASAETNIEAVTSRRECELIFEFKDQDLAVLRLAETAVVGRDEKRIWIEPEVGNRVDILHLLSPAELKSASETLKLFCSKNQ